MIWYYVSQAGLELTVSILSRVHLGTGVGANHLFVGLSFSDLGLTNRQSWLASSVFPALCVTPMHSSQGFNLTGSGGENKETDRWTHEQKTGIR